MSTSSPTEAEIPAIQRPIWIAEAAYYRAERRGFQGGCPVADWLAAEREMDQTAASSTPSPRVALVFLERRPASGVD
ncbi:MAG: DUF2934 domain-containing protein [Candidatus Competibacteraceae bacterium]|jgi:hypothetical protein